MLPPSSARRKAVRAVRGVTRALGGVREMDVTMGILDELAARPALPRGALEDVRTHVAAERDQRRQRMLERLRQVKRAKLERRLDEVVGRKPEPSDHDWQATLRVRVERRAARLQEAVDRVGRVYAPDGLHQVRIAAKKLRYTLEIAVEGRLSAARPLVRLLKRAQDTLGRLHDLQIILQHIGAVQADASAAGAAIDGGLRVLAAFLEEECRHLHARYSAQVRVLQELAAACRTGLLPGGGRRAPLRMLRPATRIAATRPA